MRSPRRARWPTPSCAAPSACSRRPNASSRRAPTSSPARRSSPRPRPSCSTTASSSGIRITTTQMEARLSGIRASLTEGGSTNLISAGIILGSLVSAGAILLMPFMSGSGTSWSLGWFGAMVSPLILGVLVAAARATILRPYSPDEDLQLMRQSMGHVLYMHQVLVEEARSTHDRRLNERQERFDETRERVAQSFRQQLSLLTPSIASFVSAAQALGPEWSCAHLANLGAVERDAPGDLRRRDADRHPRGPALNPRAGAVPASRSRCSSRRTPSHGRVPSARSSRSSCGSSPPCRRATSASS